VLALARPVYLGFDSLDVGAPNSIGLSIRVADIMPEMSALATNITLSHFFLPPALIIYFFATKVS
jgi:hypothetical protein